MPNTLEDKIKELIATAKTEGEIVARLHDAGYRFEDDTPDSGYFNVYVPRRDYDGAVRIYKPYGSRKCVTQTWRKFTAKYSGIPTFFGGGL